MVVCKKSFDAKGLVRTLVRTIAHTLVRTIAHALVRTKFVQPCAHHCAHHIFLHAYLAQGVHKAYACAHPCAHLCMHPCAHHDLHRPGAHHAGCRCARTGVAKHFPAQGLHKPRIFAKDHIYFLDWRRCYIGVLHLHKIAPVAATT